MRVFEKWTLSIVRKYSANLRTSVQRDFELCLDEYNLWDYIEINKSEKTYKYGSRMIEFIGIDDPQKARWPRRDILYCNEANELTWEDYFQLSIRTDYKIFIDFNPDDEDIWINQELELRRSREKWDVNLVVSTYRDNPFLGKEIREDIERLESTDDQYWKIYGLGEYGKLEWLIFSYSDIGSVPDGARLVWYGQDFGYTNDPSAFVWVYLWNNSLILDEEFYLTGLTNSDIANRYKDAGISKSAEIFGDSSEPKSIEEIYRYGYNIKWVTKWPDSIQFGIDTMKQYPIFITARSVNLKKEMKKYIWKKDKEGKSLNVPIDNFNHAIDASRYLVMMKLKKNNEKKFLLIDL